MQVQTATFDEWRAEEFMSLEDERDRQLQQASRQTRRSDGWSRRPAGSWPAPPADLYAALDLLRDRSNSEDRARGPPPERTIRPRRRTCRLWTFA